MDYGKDGGFCEPCPRGVGDYGCERVRYNHELGTAECNRVCVETGKMIVIELKFLKKHLKFI